MIIRLALVAGALLLPLHTQAADDFDHSHADWHTLMSKHVENGLVDYRAIGRDPALKRYIAALGNVSGTTLGEWTREQRLAYWINAYNAFTVQAILDNYPIKRRGLKGRLYPSSSIRQIPGVWDKLAFSAGGRQITLHDIEHEVLRKRFNEPRIHFAIVCASIGCPVLASHAFTAINLEAQLKEAEAEFVGDSDKIRIDVDKRTIHLSKIFDWFAEDFPATPTTKRYGNHAGAMTVCIRHLPADKASALKRATFKVKWLDYDWSLNEQ
jgi:hypothetical protein